MVVSVSVIYPCDSMADWELQLAAAAAQYHESIIERITSLGKDQNSKYGSTEFLLLWHHHKVEKS